MRLIVWLFRAFIFFALFAFALNNQQPVTVHWFFGQSWNASLVMVVTMAFIAGLAIGAAAMVPRWWRHRRAAVAPRETQAAPDTDVKAAAAAAEPPRAVATPAFKDTIDGQIHGV